MAEPCEVVQRVDELTPGAALLGQRSPASGRKPVVAAAALARLLDPTAFDQLLPFEPVKHGIKRGDVELKAAVGLGLDLFGKLIAVPGPCFEQRQEDQFGAPFLELACGGIGCSHMCGVY